MSEESNLVEFPAPAEIEVVIPVLSVEQKLTIRDAQYSILNLRQQALQLVEKAASAEQALGQHFGRLAAEFKIDKTKVGFNPSTLEFFLLKSKE